ncbi:MAG TPA: hypothetical protein VJS44_13550 [Pyrinomonadaceae bacterium]|nr:hypothetical protein [Pyrinomonadaceae bacterium]
MIELYFLIYRIPKMMSALARERNRSALAWSLIGIAAWLGAEIIVIMTFVLIYEIGVVLMGWPEEMPALPRLAMYVAAIAAAIGGVTIAKRILSSKSRDNSFPMPPPPPQF